MGVCLFRESRCNSHIFSFYEFNSNFVLWDLKEIMFPEKYLLFSDQLKIFLFQRKKSSYKKASQIIVAEIECFFRDQILHFNIFTFFEKIGRLEIDGVIMESFIKSLMASLKVLKEKDQKTIDFILKNVSCKERNHSKKQELKYFFKKFIKITDKNKKN